MRSLATTTRLLELNNAIEKLNWDIIGLAEVRKMGSAIEEHSNYILYYIGETKGHHGVGFIVKKIYKKQITSFIGISERVALLKMNFKNGPLSLIQVYAPTESSDEGKMDKFYYDLEKAIEMADKNFLIMGDFNSKIGQPKPHEKPIMGNYGYGQRNTKGERLIAFAQANKLSILNTFFKKKRL